MDKLPHEGGTLPNASKLFFRKMENFFSIRKCINWENGKIHLGQCKAKLFFAVISPDSGSTGFVRSCFQKSISPPGFIT